MLLLLVRRLLRQRPELRVLLMSASVDTKLFSQYFDNAPVIDVRALRGDVSPGWEYRGLHI